jgi:hypothetical protein
MYVDHMYVCVLAAARHAAGQRHKESVRCGPCATDRQEEVISCRWKSYGEVAVDLIADASIECNYWASISVDFCRFLSWWTLGGNGCISYSLKQRQPTHFEIC